MNANSSVGLGLSSKKLRILSLSSLEYPLLRKFINNESFSSSAEVDYSTVRFLGALLV